MKINSVDGSGALLEVQERGRGKVSQNASVEESHRSKSGSSQVEISDRARLMKSAFDTAKATPDFREGRVNLLKNSIKDGSYRIDNEAVAEKLLAEHLESDFGKNNI